MPGIETVTQRTFFAGLARKTDGTTCVSFYNVAKRPDGKKRTVSFAMPVEDEDVLRRLEKIEVGEEIEITIETDWTTKGIPSRVLGFSRIAQATNGEQAA